MATEQKVSYPTLPAKQWWKLKEKFLKSIPNAVTPGYLATTLEMTATSARTNIIPALLQLGIIDSTGKPTPRANLWRNDDTYPQVCKEMFEEIYPAELRDAVPSSELNRTSIQQWFLQNTGTGIAQVQKMASMYIILAEADPSKKETIKTTNNGKSNIKAKPRSKEVVKKASVESMPLEKAIATTVNSESHHGKFAPAIHIDLQIHISPDSSAEQINMIFESMSKHLFKMKHE